MIKRFFKRIGRGIKKAFKKIGKFFGKMGIIGQIGLMMFLPGIGGALMKGLGNVAGKLIAGNAGILKGVGHVLKGAHSFVQGGINAFRTVTEGVTSFVSQFTKTAASKLGFNVTDAAPDFFGKGGAWERVQSGIVQNAKSIFDPFRSNITITQGMQDSLIDNQTNLDIVSRNTGISKDMLTRLNPDSAFKVGDVINVDVGTLQPIPNGEIVTGLDGADQILKESSTGIQPSKELGLEFEKGPSIDETIFKPTDNMIAGEYDVMSQGQLDDLLKDNVIKKPSYLDMSVPESVTPKVPVNSIIADRPVSVSTQTDSLIGDAITETTSTDKKGLFSRIIPEPIQKVGTEIYDKAGKVAKVQSLVSAFGADKMPDSGFYSQGIVQAEQAPSLDMGYGDPQYFNPNVLGQYYQEMQNMPHGTAALFDTTDAWNTWSSRYTAGGSSPIFN